MPEHCPSCGSTYIRTCGIGTQRVEQEIRRIWPDVGVLRMDVDTTARKDDLLNMLTAFREHKAQVLVDLTFLRSR